MTLLVESTTDRGINKRAGDYDTSNARKVPPNHSPTCQYPIRSRTLVSQVNHNFWILIRMETSTSLLERGPDILTTLKISGKDSIQSIQNKQVRIIRSKEYF